MDQRIVKILVVIFLLNLILAPFAGLAPLMLFLIGTGLLWGVWTIAQILIVGSAD